MRSSTIRCLFSSCEAAGFDWRPHLDFGVSHGDDAHERRNTRLERAMFTRILMPLDGSARAEEAILLARQLGEESRAQVFLLYVDATRAETTPAPDVARRLEAIATELRHAGHEAHVLTLSGQIPTTIAATAEVHGIDLIVLAPEMRGALATLRHPSVTAGMLARTATPLLVAPSHQEGATVPPLASNADWVIVPLDGSALAEQALPLAVRLAESYQRGLLLARVNPTIQAAMGGIGVAPMRDDLAAALLRETQTYMHDVKRRILQSCQAPVEWVVLSGAPATELLLFVETKPGSVVVMSTHGRSGLARFMMGSVALELARKAVIPTFIVPAVASARHAEAFNEPTEARPAGA
jgi:nucleotide-binding universal stress UspA family protein